MKAVAEGRGETENTHLMMAAKTLQYLLCTVVSTQHFLNIFIISCTHAQIPYSGKFS